MIEQKVSRGKLSAALGTGGFISRVLEKHAVKKAVGKATVGGGNESGAVGDRHAGRVTAQGGA